MSDNLRKHVGVKKCFNLNGCGVRKIGCYTSQTKKSVIFVMAHRCPGGLKKKFDLRSDFLSIDSPTS